MSNFPKIWNLNKNWETVFNKNLNELESDWHNWLISHFSEQ